MFDPGLVMNQVDEAATRLEQAADVYSATVARFEKAETAYDLAMAIETKKAYFSSAKPPAEDVRKAMALTLIDDEIRTEFAAAKAEKESQAVRFRSLVAATTARQSLLKALQGT